MEAVGAVEAVEVIKKPGILIRLIKAIKCKSKCCSGSSCQIGDYEDKE